MPSKVRLFWLPLILCLMTPLFSACRMVAPAPTPAPVTIHMGVLDVVGEQYDPLIERFGEAYPHITVEIVNMFSPELDILLAPSYQLSMLRNGGGRPGVPNGLIAMDPYVEADSDLELADFSNAAVEALRQDGQLWGIPAQLDMMMAYYNKDIFDAYGVPYPEPGWTWDEFLLTAGQVTHPEQNVFGYAPVDPMMDALTIIYARGGWIMDDVRHPTRMTFNAPEVIDALDWYTDLFYVYNVAPTQDQARAADMSTMVGSIYQNKVAIWLASFAEQGGSNNAQATFPALWKMRWGVVPLPTDRRSSAMGTVNAYYMVEGADNTEACWQWITWLTLQVPSKALPARIALLESAAFEDQVGEEVAAMARAALQDAEILSPDLLAFGSAFGAFDQALTSITRGIATPQEAMDSAQAVAERLQ